MDGSRGSFCLALQLPAVDDDDGGGVSLQRRCVRARGVERKKGMTTLQFIVYICQTGNFDKNRKKEIIFRFKSCNLYKPHLGNWPKQPYLAFPRKENGVDFRAAPRQSSVQPFLVNNA